MDRSLAEPTDPWNNTAFQRGVGPGRLVAAVVSRFPVGWGAVLTITTHTGCLVCEN